MDPRFFWTNLGGVGTPRAGSWSTRDLQRAVATVPRPAALSVIALVVPLYLDRLRAQHFRAAVHRRYRAFTAPDSADGPAG